MFGASGAMYGIRVPEVLNRAGGETHHDVDDVINGLVDKALDQLGMDVSGPWTQRRG